MRFLRSNTAVIITVGPFFDKTDGVTLETALTITNERITLTADTDDGSAPTNILDNVTGATSGTANDLNYITGNDAAMMQLEFSAANVNRLGRMFLSITDAANHVPVFHEFMVINAALYDAFCAAAGGAIPNAVAGAIGGLLTAPVTANLPLGAIPYVTGTADSGTTTTMVDAARTEGDDYWNDALIVFTSGTLNSVARRVTDFVASSDTMTLSPATPVAVDTHTYIMIPATQSISDVEVANGNHGNAALKEGIDDTMGLAAEIAAKTGQLTFTYIGQADVHVARINTVPVVGAGTSGDKWRA